MFFVEDMYARIWGVDHVGTPRSKFALVSGSSGTVLSRDILAAAGVDAASGGEIRRLAPALA
jgi:hypothetical protein